VATETPAQARPVDALLVIDMQNSFCNPDGIMYAALGPPLFEIEATVKATAAAVAAARAARVPVVFTRHQYQPGHADFGRLFAQFRELLEDFADAQAARESLAEVEAGAEPVPAEQVWAELGLGT